jgi:hypothetical protein
MWRVRVAVRRSSDSSLATMFGWGQPGKAGPDRQKVGGRLRAPHTALLQRIWLTGDSSTVPMGPASGSGRL